MLVRRIRSRGANIVVEANAEVLFAATGDVGRWTNRFSQRARAFVEQEAPSNKRPRWGHYGKPLRATITASTTYQPARLRVYSAVGSSARHAYYVDQGTGVYAGNGAYPAKVLPPWLPTFDLYEATWRPGGPGARKVRPVMIKGQKGQGFFDKGLSRAFRSMRMRAFQVPGEGGPKISEALNSMPTGMENFVGNTPNDTAFRTSLQEWRAWRDARFKAESTVGPRETAKPRKTRPAKPKSGKPTKPAKAKKPTKPKGPNKAALATDKAKFLAAMMKKYGASNVEVPSLEYEGGYWYITVRTKGEDGRPMFKEIRAKSKV